MIIVNGETRYTKKEARAHIATLAKKHGGIIDKDGLGCTGNIRAKMVRKYNSKKTGWVEISKRTNYGFNQ